MERQWLEQQCDAIGECDQCHKDDSALWEDTENEGGFMICRDCWLKILAKRAKDSRKDGA